MRFVEIIAIKNPPFCPSLIKARAKAGIWILCTSSMSDLRYRCLFYLALDMAFGDGPVGL